MTPLLALIRFALASLLCLSASLITSCSDQTEKKSPSPEKKITPQGETLFSLLKARETGVHFMNHLPEDLSNDNNVLSYQYYFNGGGVAVGDINNDSLPDLFFTANKTANKLYINKGNLKFEDVTEKSGVGSMRFSTGATFIDINRDGLLDLYVCNAGPSKKEKERENQLYINQGDGTFSEEAAKYGINDPNHSTQASFLDYDKDGDLDLFVMNHSIYFKNQLSEVFEILKDKETLRKVSGKLFRNDNGHYEDVTEESGLLKHAYGIGLAVSDVNNDGWPDMYISNDFSIPDYFFINNGDGTFTDQQKELTQQITWFGMGCDIADINNDGLLDVGVLDMAANDHVRSKTLMASMNPTFFNALVDQLGYQRQYMFNSLQLNNGNGTFSNIANLSGTAKTDWSWSALFADLDNDGYKDYLVTNGFRRYTLDNDFQIALRKAKNDYRGNIPLTKRKELYNLMPQIKLANYAFHNKGDLSFENMAKAWGLNKPSYSNGSVYADLDLDGDLDLVINNIDQKAFVYRNNSEKLSSNNYLRVNLIDDSKGSAFYNAKVYIYYNNEQQVLEYAPTRGYQSSVEHNLHFGLGEQEIVDRLVVKWLDGSETVLEDIAANQKLDIHKAKGSKRTLTHTKPSIFTLADTKELGIQFSHRENNFDDFSLEGLLPHRQSQLGPFSAVADVNGDGLEDFFIGGASGQPGRLYLQMKNGTFNAAPHQPWVKDAASEDMNSLFFDADGDKDLDLYIVSGGAGEFKVDSPELQDRLYINNGTGKFVKDENALPEILVSGQQVKAADIDRDGDLDLFIGGRIIPGKYPYSPKSYLLENRGGKFIDITKKWAPELENVGLVTDFLFTDFNQDDKPDLIVIGEWMKICMMENKGDVFADVSSKYSTNNLLGWWYSIEEGDFNEDGKPDYLIGNIGKNTKFKASSEEPFHIFTNDFDDNGDQDIVLSNYYKGKKVPVRGRECSSGEMPFIKDKCPSYKSFAEASLEDIYGEKKLAKAKHLESNEFKTILLLSQSDGLYEQVKLPNEVQMSPVNRFLILDSNKDGHQDIILAGNMFHTEVETPRYDSGRGLLLEGDGTGHFKALSVLESGIYAAGDVKDIDLIRIKNKLSLLVSNNNDKPQIFTSDL